MFFDVRLVSLLRKWHRITSTETHGRSRRPNSCGNAAPGVANASRSKASRTSKRRGGKRTGWPVSICRKAGDAVDRQRLRSGRCFFEGCKPRIGNSWERVGRSEMAGRCRVRFETMRIPSGTRCNILERSWNSNHREGEEPCGWRSARGAGSRSVLRNRFGFSAAGQARSETSEAGRTLESESRREAVQNTVFSARPVESTVQAGGSGGRRSQGPEPRVRASGSNVRSGAV